MGQLFDRMTAGLPPNPNRAANWIAVGSGLSQLAQGGPVDLSQHHARIQQRNDQQEERKGLTGAIESLKEELGPERYKALLGAPPAIQKAIVAKWYEQQLTPKAPVRPQWIPGVGFVDPNNIPENLMAGNFVPPEDKPNDKERAIARLQDVLGYSEEEAVRMVDLYNVNQDGSITALDGSQILSADSMIPDHRVGTPSAAPPPQAGIETTALPGMQQADDRPDITQIAGEALDRVDTNFGNVPWVIGPRGKAGVAFNWVIDAASGYLPAPEIARAKAETQALSTDTMLVLSSEWGGRPSNLTREEVKNMTVQPNVLFSSPGDSYYKVTALRSLIEGQLDSTRAMVNDAGFTPAQRSSAREQHAKLLKLFRKYEDLAANLEAAGYGPQSGAGADPEIDAIADKWAQ